MNRSKYDYDKIFEYICNYKKENDGNSPTIRDIRDEFNVSSTSVVDYILNKLEEKNLIFRPRNKSRGINVVGGKWIMEL